MRWIGNSTFNYARSRGRAPLDGEENTDSGAFAGVGFDFDFAAMGFDDAADDGETEAGSFGFGGVQNGAENAAAMFFSHALAGVAELNGDVAQLWVFTRDGNQSRGERDRAAVGHCFSRVENEIKECLFQLHALAGDVGQIRLKFSHPLNVLIL